MLTKKKMTKLLNADFRKRILSQMKLADPDKNKKIPAYARYVVDTQIMNREKKYENDKSAYYGFSPIYPLCAILKDDSFSKMFFEFNIVNHFLKELDGQSAVEVVECMLVEWCKDNKQIKDFDIDKIDAELAKIEYEYLEKQKKQKEKNEKIAQVAKEIRDSVAPIVENKDKKSLNEVKSATEDIVKKFKDNEKIFKYVIDMSRNTSQTEGQVFVDIGFNVEEGDELVVLACHSDLSKVGTLTSSGNIEEVKANDNI